MNLVRTASAAALITLVAALASCSGHPGASSDGGPPGPYPRPPHVGVVGTGSGDAGPSGGDGGTNRGDAGAGHSDAGTSGGNTGANGDAGGGGGNTGANGDAGGNGGNTGTPSDAGMDGGDATTNPAGADGGTGTVGGHMSMGPGVSIASLQWLITNGGVRYVGTVTVDNSRSAEWVAGGIAEGNGYTLTVTGTDSDGDPCSGVTVPFAVQAGATVHVVLAVSCFVSADSAPLASVETDSGDVDESLPPMNGSFSDCPSITSLSMNPADQAAGVPAQFGVMTSGPAAPVTWTVAPGGVGSFSDIHSMNPTFTCTNDNQNPLTVTATVGQPDAGICSGQEVTTLSAFFVCESPATACAELDPATPDSCPGTDGSPTCVDFASDPNHCGSCTEVCPAGATCHSGACVQ
jgi:hypothetical protein